MVDANATFAGPGRLGGRIVKLGNGGIWGHATRIGAQASWLEAERPSTEANAELVVLSTIGQLGILGGSRTSDFPVPGSMGSIGITGYGINDNAVQVQTGYAGYFEARAKPGTGTTAGVEIDIANQSGVLVSNHPYRMGPTGSTLNLWLASGAGAPGASPASLGLGIMNNGSSFDKGIVFGADSITGTDGITGSGTAIALAKGHALQWYGAGGVAIGAISNTVATSAKRTHLTFSDAGAAITGESGQQLLLVPDVPGAANFAVFNAAPAGTGVHLSAQGADSNVGITLAPKGAGTVRVTTGLDVSNGHVRGDIASVALPGNSTTTGASLLGWNRSNGGGESNFVNARGAGKSAGFDWRTWSGTADTKIMSLSSTGALATTGPVTAVGTMQLGKTVISNNASTKFTVPANVSYVGFTGTQAAMLEFRFPAASKRIDGLEVAIFTQAAVGTEVKFLSTGASFVAAPATLGAGSVTRFIFDYASHQWLPR